MRPSVWLSAVAVVLVGILATALVVWAADKPAAGKPDAPARHRGEGCPVMRPRDAEAGPGTCGLMGRRAAMHGARGKRLGFGGYIKPTPESEKLWKRLGELMATQHQKRWELFVLRSQDKVDEQALQAKQTELLKGAQEMRSVLQELAPYRVAGPGRGARADCSCPHCDQQPPAPPVHPDL